MKPQKILITGHKSGLGRYLYEQFEGIGLGRNMPADKFEQISREGVDVIIHCAFNSSSSVDSTNLFGYLSDNVLLTEELLNIPHKKFIFMSSVDVYPKDKKNHRENEVIDINSVDRIYGVTKLMSEALVIKKSQKFLILRCTAMLGKYSRKNSLIKILEDEPCKLILTQDSRLNYILHCDVSDFIQFAIKNDLRGIYNVACSKSVELKEVAAMIGKRVQFGKYNYDVGNIDNRKITSIFPTFKKTSREIVSQFIATRE